MQNRALAQILEVHLVEKATTPDSVGACGQRPLALLFSMAQLKKKHLADEDMAFKHPNLAFVAPHDNMRRDLTLQNNLVIQVVFQG